MYDYYRRNKFKFFVILMMVIVPILLMLLNTQSILRYESLKTIDNQWWRWLSGHWVHLTWGHLWMNLIAMLALCATFYENHSAKDWLISSMGMCLCITLAFIVFSPQLTWYVGLSGLLHGLFVYLVLSDHKLTPILKGLFVAALSAKLAWEQLYGSLPGSEELAGGNVVVDAHFYGAISGLLCFIVATLLKKSLK